MTDIRWIALLPDSLTGLDTPIVGADGKTREWLAPDRETAKALIKASITPNQFRLAVIRSVIEHEAAQDENRLRKSAEDKAKFYRHAHRSAKK